jgi:hypothetical protein
MALTLENVSIPATVPSSLPSLMDWLRLWLPSHRLAAVNNALAARAVGRARRRLQQRAARHLQAGECGVLASLIVAGNWDALDRICDALEEVKA